MTTAVSRRPGGRSVATAPWVFNGPWQRREAAWPAARIVAGAALIGIAWYGCSGTLGWEEQSTWIAVGAIGLIVALSGVAGWIRVGLRNVRRLERLLVGSAHEHLIGGRAIPGQDAQIIDITTGRGVLITARGSTFHRRDCLLLAGKPVVEHGRDDATRAGLSACGMCVP